MKRAVLVWFALVLALRGAALEFPQTLKEVHAPAEAKTVAVEFDFTNRTDKPVQVSRYDPTCSCMSVSIRGGKLRYEPGESGVIRAEFDMGNFSGEVDKAVAVYLNDDPDGKPSVVLTTRVHIPVLIALEPKTQKWAIGGAAEAKVIRIAMNHAKPIRVTGVSSSSQAFKHELKTVEEGKTYELIVTPLETKGPALAIFRVETDCDIAKHRTQQAFAVIRKPIPGEKP